MQLLGITIDDETLNSIRDKALAVLFFLPKVLLALLFVIIGCRIINCIASRLQRRLESIGTTSEVEAQKDDEESQNSFSTRASTRSLTRKSLAKVQEEAKLDPTLVKFTVSLASNALKCFLLLTGASMVSIETTSFLAVLTASSLAVGLALQGLLKDFAAGVLLLVFRPYTVGDLVNAAEQTGRVSEIGMFETTLLSLDNKTIIIPNSQVTIVTNLSSQDTIRIDVTLKISHETSLRQAKEVLLRVAEECQCILSDRAPQVLVSDTSELGRDLIIRAYVRSEDYISAPFILREQALLALDEARLLLASMPFMLPYLKKQLQSPV